MTLLDHYTHYDGRRIELWKADRYHLVRIVPVRGKAVQHPSRANGAPVRHTTRQ
jgi:hypothetical protein